MDIVNDDIKRIKAAAQRDMERFQTLAPVSQLTGDVRGVKDSRYLMYKIDKLISNDGSFIYEFLIEYDTFLPSQGIYLGCKAITLNGFFHSNTILQSDRDWEMVINVIIGRLNNIFVDKDFVTRFRQTDNENDGTYWPFWISLHEDEDVKEIGVRMLTIIANTYFELLTGQLASLEFKPQYNNKKLPIHTAFTASAFEKLESNIKKNIKVLSIKEMSHNGEVAWNLFLHFLTKATEHGLLKKLNHYEKGWALAKEYSDIDMKSMMLSLFDLIGNKIGLHGIKVPWNSLIDIFLRYDESTFKIQLKTLLIKEEKQKYWDNKINELFN